MRKNKIDIELFKKLNPEWANNLESRWSSFFDFFFFFSCCEANALTSKQELFIIVEPRFGTRICPTGWGGEIFWKSIEFGSSPSSRQSITREKGELLPLSNSLTKTETLILAVSFDYSCYSSSSPKFQHPLSRHFEFKRELQLPIYFLFFWRIQIFRRCDHVTQ